METGVEAGNRTSLLLLGNPLSDICTLYRSEPTSNRRDTPTYCRVNMRVSKPPVEPARHPLAERVCRPLLERVLSHPSLISCSCVVAPTPLFTTPGRVFHGCYRTGGSHIICCARCRRNGVCDPSRNEIGQEEMWVVQF